VAAQRHHAHALGAAGDHHVRVTQADAVGRKRHRLHARGAEAVDRHARHGIGKPGKQQPDAGDIHALLRFRHRATDDHVVHGFRAKTGTLTERGFQHEREHVVGTHVPEHASRRLAHRGARGSHDVGILNLFAHGTSPKCRIENSGSRIESEMQD
jgi:hypothetical protein